MLLNQQKVQDIPIDFSFDFSEYHSGNNISLETLIKIVDNGMYDAELEKKSTQI